MRHHKLPVIALACALAAFCALVAAALPPPVSAHAFVIGSDPVDGTTISSAPAVVRIFFNAPISSASIARLYGVEQGNFVEVATVRSTISAGNARELDTQVINPTSLPQGSYEVKWTAVSNDDGHTTYGLIGFNLGFSSNGLSGKPTLGPSSSNTLSVRDLTMSGILTVVWDWFVLAALTLLIGLLLIEHLLIPRLALARELLDRTSKKVRALHWLCLSALLVGEVVALVLYATRLTQLQGSGGLDPNALLQLLFQTNYGYIWIVRIVLIILSIVLLTRAQQQPAAEEPLQARTLARSALTPAGAVRGQTTQPHVAVNPAKEATDLVATSPPTHATTWLVLAALLSLTYALTHNAALVQQPHITSIVLEWLRLLAQSVWFGSLAYLGYILLPLFPIAELDRHTDLLTAFLRQLVPWVLAGMAVTVLFALFTSEVTINSPALLLNDPYGRTLLVQLILTLLLIPLTLVALFALPRKLARQVAILPVVDAELPARRTRQSALEKTAQGMRQSTRILALLAAAILLCSALLSYFAPPIVFPDITYIDPGAAGPSINAQTRQMGDLSVTLLIQPGRVGVDNTLIMTLSDSSGKQVTNAQITLTINMLAMDMGTITNTITNGNPAYVVTVPHNASFDMAGVWNIDLRIQRPGHATVTGSFQVNIADSSPSS